MRPKGGWKNVADAEIAVAEDGDWFNHQRLHGETELIPPAEFEANTGTLRSSTTALRYAPRPGLALGNRAATNPGRFT